MRVIGGRAKGRRLLKPTGVRLRPTSDMIKEALFNFLPDISGTNFLELFAGTGGIGIEASSRGAARVVFVENNPSCIEMINRNILLCGMDTGWECLASDVDLAVKMLGRRGESFDFIFLDPPYEEGLVERTIIGIGNAQILCPEGEVIVQHSIREPLAEETEILILERQRKYGDTLLSFLRLK
jgi:16S rRNA (guanine966-N2)-methyltransferase